MRVLDDVSREKGDFPLGGTAYSRIRDKLPRVLDVLEESAQRIRHIVDDLRDFSRVTPAADLRPFQINDVAGKAARLTGNAIRKATGCFRLELGRDLPPVRGNAQRIEQVVVNLLLNACQALPGPDRGITLATAYLPEFRAVHLTVADEGVGIPPEDLPRLTDPFFTTKRASGGTGLGLSVSAGIVKAHGGSLSFTSSPGQGTTACLSLPVTTGAGA